MDKEGVYYVLGGDPFARALEFCPFCGTQFPRPDLVCPEPDKAGGIDACYHQARLE
jgi:ligand-binding sensor protein